MSSYLRCLLRSSRSANPCIRSSIRRSGRDNPPYYSSHSFSSSPYGAASTEGEEIPTPGISRPLSEVLKELNKRVPDSLVKTRLEEGTSIKYIPWHIVNRIMNVHAPEWSGEVRSVTHSPDGKSVSVVYRVTLYGVDSEIFRESTGTASVDDTIYGDPMQKAEAMAFRRACARLGLGLHLYHEDAIVLAGPTLELW